MVSPKRALDWVLAHNSPRSIVSLEGIRREAQWRCILYERRLSPVQWNAKLRLATYSPEIIKDWVPQEISRVDITPIDFRHLTLSTIGVLTLGQRLLVAQPRATFLSHAGMNFQQRLRPQLP